MREEGDYTCDHDLKAHWLFQARNNLKQVKMTFDDRNKVVEMWRDEGITCFQVAPGNF